MYIHAKRLLALLLAVTLVFGLVPATAFAEETAPGTDVTEPTETATSPPTDPPADPLPTDPADSLVTEPSTVPETIVPAETETPDPEPSEPETTAPTEHTHSYSETVIPPTCVAKGYSSYVCSCGDSYTDNETETVDHTMEEAVDEADCVLKYICSVCGYSNPDKPGVGRPVKEEVSFNLLHPRARAIVDTAVEKTTIFTDRHYYWLWATNFNGSWRQYGEYYFQEMAYYKFASGEIGYCLEPYNDNAAINTERIEIDWDDIHPPYESWGHGVEQEKRRTVALVMAYGAPNNGDRTESGYWATAAMIWAAICGHVRPDGSLRDDSHIFLKGLKAGMWNRVDLYYEAEAKYYEILQCLSEHGKRPSFSTDSRYNISEASTITLNYNSSTGKYEASVLDTNGVLKHFNYQSTVDGLTFFRSGNTLNISATPAAAASLNNTALTINNRGHDITIGPDSVLVWNVANGNAQSMVTMHTHADPVPSYFALRAATGSLNIQKTTSDGQNLAGWQFEVYTDAACTKKYDIPGDSDDILVTDSNGVTPTVSGIMPGTIYVKEIGNVDNSVTAIYSCAHSNPVSVSVTSGGTATAKFTNNRNPGYFSITKSTSDGNNLTGWSFSVVNAATGASVGTYTITSGNSVVVGPVAPGSYLVTEVVSAGSQYEPSTNPQTVVVYSNDTAATCSVNFHNVLKTGSLTVRKTTEDNANLSGWQFALYADAACTQLAFGPVSTDANGNATFSNVVAKDYYLKEIGHPTANINNRYVCVSTNPQRVTVKPGETVTGPTFVNNVRRGGIRITKSTNTGRNLGDWTFQVFDSAGTLVGTVKTNAQGIATLTDLWPGTYTVREVQNHTGMWIYDSQDKSVTVVGGVNDAPVSFLNINYGQIEVTKTTNTGKNLDGWTFDLYNSAGTLLDSKTTGADGKVLFDKLVPDTYTVRERQDRTGMWIYDTQDKSVTVEVDKTAPVSYRNVNYGQLKVTKTTNTGNNLDGWTFELYNSAGTLVDTKTTDATGIVLFDKLPPDTYTVRERQDRSGMWIYDTLDKTVQVEVDKTAQTSFHNINYGQLQVTKTTNTGNNLDGWTFDLYNSAGTLVDTRTTDANGVVLFDKLVPDTYTVKERQEHGGMWIYDTETKTVTVEVNKMAQTRFHNINYGQLRVVKAIADNGAGADLGWTFNLWKVNGTDRNDPSQWQFISSGTTAKDANDPSYIWTELEPGLYVIQEETVRDTHQSDTSYHFVSVTVDTTYSHTVTNIEYGVARVKKATNTGVDLNDWNIDIYSDSICTTLVTTLTTDDNGDVWTYLVPGTYYFREQGSADPYWISDVEVKELVVAPGGDYTVNFFNNHMGKIFVTKTLDTDGPVDGWQFIIRDKDGKEIEGSPFVSVGKEIDGKVVGFLETDLLQPGEYIIEEIIPENSLYYCKTENPLTVTVTAGADTEAQFVNALRPGQIILDKVNWAGEKLAGATFLLEWSENGTDWYPVVYSHSLDVVKGGCSNPNLVDGHLTTGEDGKLEFDNLYPGLQYRLTEIEAPNGYLLLADYAFLGELPIDDLTVPLIVYNSQGYLLPTTGSVGTIHATGGTILAIVALMGLAMMLALPRFNAIPANISDSGKNKSKKGNNI